MKKFLFVLSVAILAPTMAAAQGVAADRLVCDNINDVTGERELELQVCVTPDADGVGYKPLTDGRARVRPDCDVSQPRGVALRCVAESDVLTAEQAACEALDGDWRWSRRHERCYQHVEPREEREGAQGGGGCNGSSTCSSGVAVQVPRCTDVDRSRLADELDRIESDLQVVTDFRPRQERAAEIYGVLVACDDGSTESRRLIDRAADMIQTFEPDPASDPDYTDEFRAIRDQIAALEDRPIVVTPPAEEGNWCDDNPVACGFLIAGAILAAGGVTVGVVCGVGLCEDDPGLPDHIFYQ